MVVTTAFSLAFLIGRPHEAWGHLLTAIGLGFDISGVWMLANAVLISDATLMQIGTIGGMGMFGRREALSNRIEARVGLYLAAAGFVLQLLGDLLG